MREPGRIPPYMWNRVMRAAAIALAEVDRSKAVPFARDSAVALAAMTGLSVVLGWAVAGRVLRPLQRITATAKRVSQDNLDERIGL